MLHFSQGFYNDTVHNHFKVVHNAYTGYHLLTTKTVTLLVSLQEDKTVPSNTILIGKFFRNTFSMQYKSKVQLTVYEPTVYTAKLIVIENGNDTFLSIIKGMKYVQKGFAYNGSRIIEIDGMEKGYSHTSYFEIDEIKTRIYFQEKRVECFGMDKQIEEFSKVVYATLIEGETLRRYKLKSVNTMLLYADHGMYEQAFLESVCMNLKVNYLYFDFTDASKEFFEQTFKNLQSYKPCIVSLSGIIRNSTECMKSLRTFLKDLSFQDSTNEICVVINVNNIEDLDDLKNKLNIEKVFKIEKLKGNATIEVITNIIKYIPNNLQEHEIDIIADGIKGKTIREVELIFSDYITSKLYKKPDAIEAKCNVFEQKPYDYSSLFLKEIDEIDYKMEKVEICDDLILTYKDFSNSVFNKFYTCNDQSITKPDITFADIGGYDNIKRILEESVIWSMTHKDLFKRMDVRLVKGIILYGPPGCSKTLFARALAGESKMSFISIKGSELENKYVGETDRNIRDLFEKARERSPCIIFIDEIDSIAQKGTHMHHAKALAAFLTEMDGFTENENIIVVGATNKIDRIHDAFLRPGRIDKKIMISLPDKNARKEIFKLKLGFYVDQVFINQTENLSGAEITLICQEAKMKVVRRRVNGDDSDEMDVCSEDIRLSIEEVINEKNKRKYKIKKNK